MNIKQTQLLSILLPAFIIAASISLLFSTNAFAAACGGVETSIIACDEPGGQQIEDTGLWGILLLVINIFTAGIGIAAVAGVVYGSILYTSAGGSQEQVKKAMGVFTNVAIGVIAYAGMYALLNFIIPGGLFN